MVGDSVGDKGFGEKNSYSVAERLWNEYFVSWTTSMDWQYRPAVAKHAMCNSKSRPTAGVQQTFLRSWREELKILHPKNNFEEIRSRDPTNISMR